MTLAERYRLVRLLGMGGMGEVWQGVRLGPAGFTRPVAIKLVRAPAEVRDAMTTLFLDEARLTARLSHPNLVQVHELAQDGDDWFMVLEYVEGVDLAAVLRRMRALGEHLPVPVALYIVGQLLRALDHAHTAVDDEGLPLGIVHRDVSPANLMCGYRTGVVQLTDFGIARANIQRHMTEAGVRRGKLAYMAPEQWHGDGLDHRADLYAVGRIMLELLVGELPPDTKGARPSKHALTPRAMTPALERIALRALDRDPTQRWASARTMLNALEPYLRDSRAGEGFATLLERILPRATALYDQARAMDQRLRSIMSPAAGNTVTAANVVTADLILVEDEEPALLAVGTPSPVPALAAGAAPAQLAKGTELSMASFTGTSAGHTRRHAMRLRPLTRSDAPTVDNGDRAMVGPDER